MAMQALTNATDPDDLTKLHDAYDEQKLKTLEDDMAENGWDGEPLLADGDDAITGTHRIEAARQIGLDNVPVVQVRDLIRDAGGHPGDYEDGWGQIQFQRLSDVDGIDEFGDDIYD